MTIALDDVRQGRNRAGGRECIPLRVLRLLCGFFSPPLRSTEPVAKYNSVTQIRPQPYVEEPALRRTTRACCAQTFTEMLPRFNVRESLSSLIGT